MQRLEVSGAVRPLYGSLGVKGLNPYEYSLSSKNATEFFKTVTERVTSCRSTCIQHKVMYVVH